jgi:hypothetical protein
MIDHRRTISDLALGFRQTWERWMAIGALAERLVTQRVGNASVPGGLGSSPGTRPSQSF